MMQHSKRFARFVVNELRGYERIIAMMAYLEITLAEQLGSKAFKNNGLWVLGWKLSKADVFVLDTNAKIVYV